MSPLLTRLARPARSTPERGRSLGRLLGGLLLFLVFGPVALAGAEDIRVVASFQPSTITLGQRVDYVVQVEGTRESLRGSLPAVSGLEVGGTPRTSTSQNVQVINGRMQASLTVTYAFPARAGAEGRYVLPAWTAVLGDESVTVPAATLEVVAPGEEFRNALLLRLEPAPARLYSGQTWNAVLRLYVREDVNARLLSNPVKGGDAFSDPVFSDQFPVTNQTLAGVAYQVASWPVTLTALKTGSQRLDFSVDLAITVPERRRRSGGDPLFDHFFNDSLFGRMGREEQRSVLTGPIPIEVLDPPAEGRPASFGGAIGQFDLSAFSSSRETLVGEPVTLTVRVSGEGNFERIPPPPFPEDPAWKVYPPKSEFTPEPSNGLRGEKAFEYILVPQSEQITEIPGLAFSYLDPATGKYTELRTAPLPLRVQPAPAAAATGRPAPLAGSAPAPAAPPPAPAQLLPIEVVADAWRDDLAPLSRQAWFWWAQVVPGLGLAGLVGWRRHRLRLSEDQSFARAQQAGRQVRTQLQLARRAAARGDASAFFFAARRALQECLLTHFPKGQRAEALAWPEIEPLLRARAVPEPVLDLARTVFETCDTLQFAPGLFRETDLNLLRDRLTSALAVLAGLPRPEPAPRSSRP